MTIIEYQNNREEIRKTLRALPADMLLSEYLIARDKANKAPQSALRSAVFTDYHVEVLSRLSAYADFMNTARKWARDDD